MFVNRLPNLVDPVTKSIEEVIVCATIVCTVSVLLINALLAVKLFLTLKLSADDADSAFTDKLAVVAKDALVAKLEDTAKLEDKAKLELVAKLAVPNKEPVNDVANTFPDTCNEAEFGIVVPIPILPLLPDSIPPPLPNFILAIV